MSFVLTFQPILIEFDPARRDAWKAGDRFDCCDPYVSALPDGYGFGEYLVGKYWEERGYDWIHHDYDIFGGNKPGKYGRSQAILAEAFGADRLATFKTLYRTLEPFREEHHVPLEAPDLLIYRPGTLEIRFAEAKRADNRDKVNRRQALGMYLLGAVLGCPVDVFVLAEAGSNPSPDPITFIYGD